MKTLHSGIITIPLLTLTLASFMIGCATTQMQSPQLTATLATANETVSQARMVGAQEHAPLELQMAEQKMKDAHLALADENPDRANRLANEAMIDARLASVKSRNAKTQAVVLELQKSIEALRQEIERSRKG